MVFESVVVELLNRYLKPYVKKLDTSQLKVGVWKGHAQLDNLELKEDLFAEADLDVPIKIKRSYIGKLELQIPWKKLTKDPLVVTVDDVYVVLEPDLDTHYDPQKELKRERTAKEKKIKDYEEAAKKRKQKEKEAKKDKKKKEKDMEKADTFVEKLIVHLTKNMQIKVRDIHVRYEDGVTNPDTLLAAGVTLHSLELKSTDSNWAPGVVRETATLIYKLVELNSLGIYFNTRARSLASDDLANEDMIREMRDTIARPAVDPPPSNTYLLSPMSALARLKMNVRTEVDVSLPQLVMGVECEDIVFSLQKKQFKALLSTVEAFDKHSVNQRYLKHKPSVSLSEGKREWWKYAIFSVKDDVKKRLEMWSWIHIKKHRERCRAYQQKYREKLHSLNPSNSLITDIQMLEDSLDWFNIVVCRNEAAKKEKKGSKRIQSTSAFAEKPASPTETAPDSGRKKVEDRGSVKKEKERQKKEEKERLKREEAQEKLRKKEEKQRRKEEESGKKKKGFFSKLKSRGKHPASHDDPLGGASGVSSKLGEEEFVFVRGEDKEKAGATGGVNVEKVADNAEKESEEEEKAMKELYEAIGYAEGEQYEYPKEYVAHEVHVDLKTVTLELVGEKELGKVITKAIKLDVLNRPSSKSVSVSASVGAISMTGVPKPDHQTIMLSSDVSGKAKDAPPLVDFQLEVHPLSKPWMDVSVKAALQPMQITYDFDTVDGLIAMFKPPNLIHFQELTQAASASWDQLKLQTTAGLKDALKTRKHFEVDVTLHSPYLVMPENGCYSKDAHLLIVDLGKLSLNGSTKDPHSLDEVAQAVEKQNQDLLYDTFNIELQGMQVLAATPSEDWRSAMKKESSPLHLLRPTGLQIQLYKSVIKDDAYLPSVRVEGTLPRFEVKLSDHQLSTLIKVGSSLKKPPALIQTTTMYNELPSRFEGHRLDSVVKFVEADAISITSSLTLDEEDDIESPFSSSSPVSPTGSIASPAYDQETARYVFTDATIKLTIQEIALKLTKSEPSKKGNVEKPVIDVIIGCMKADIVDRKWDTQGTVSMKKVAILDYITTDKGKPTYLLQTESLDDGNFISLRFVTITQLGRDFAAKYTGLDNTLSAELSLVKLKIHQSSLSGLLKYGMALMPSIKSKDQPDIVDGLPSISESIAETAPQGVNPADFQSEVVTQKELSFEVKFAGIDTVLVQRDHDIIHSGIQGFFLKGKVEPKQITIKASIKDMDVKDPMPNAKAPVIVRKVESHKDIVLLDVVQYNYHPHERKAHDLTWVDTSIKAELNRISVKLSATFLASVLEFVQSLDINSDALQTAAKATAGTATATAVAIKESAKTAHRVSFDFTVHAPVVYLPFSTKVSAGGIVIDLGDFHLSNSFQHGFQQQHKGVSRISMLESIPMRGAITILDCMQINLTSIQILRRSHAPTIDLQEISDDGLSISESQTVIMEPLKLSAQVIRNISAPTPAFPSVDVQLTLDRVKFHLHEEDIHAFISMGVIIAASLMPVTAGSSSKKTKPRSSTLLSRAKTGSTLTARSRTRTRTSTMGSRSSRTPTREMDVTKVRIKAALKDVSLDLTTVKEPLFKASVSGLNAEVNVEMKSVNVSASVDSVSVLDLEQSNSNTKILSLAEHTSKVSTVNLAINLNHDDTSKDPLGKIKANIAQIQLLVPIPFVLRTLDFIQRLDINPNMIKSATAAAQEGATVVTAVVAEAAQDKYFNIDVSVHAPVFLLPLNDEMDQALMVDLGSLTVKNTLLTPDQQHSIDAFGVKLDSFKVSRVLLDLNNEKSPITAERILLQPFHLLLAVERNLSPWYTKIPALLVNVTMGEFKIFLGQDDLEEFAKFGVAVGAKVTAALETMDFEHFKKAPDEAEDQTADFEKSLVALVEEEEDAEVYDKFRIFSTLSQFQVKMFRGEPKLDSADTKSHDLYRLSDYGLASLELLTMKMEAKILNNQEVVVEASMKDIALCDERKGSKSKKTGNRVIQHYTSNPVKASTESLDHPIVSITYMLREKQHIILLKAEKLLLLSDVDFLSATGNYFKAIVDLAMPPKTEPVVDADSELEETLTAGSAAISVPTDAGTTVQKLSIKDAPKGKSKPSPKIKVEASVKEFRVAIIEAVDEPEPQALTLKVSAYVNFKMTEDQKQGSINVAGLSIATSSFFDLDNTTSWVLLPCSMLVSLNGPKDKPAMDINVVVDPISLTISPAIVRLIIHAAKTLTPEKVSEQVVPPRNLWRKQLLHEQQSKLWFLSPVPLHQEIVNTVVPEKKGQVMTVNIESVEIILESESTSRSPGIPVLALNAMSVIQIFEWTGDLAMSGDISCEASYYNERLSIWEPILEPFETKNGRQQLWDMSIDVTKTPANQLQLDGAQATQPKISLDVTATAPLQITLSRAALELIKSLADAYAKEYGKKVEGNVNVDSLTGAPFTVVNKLGGEAALFVQPGQSMKFKDKAAFVKLSPGESTDINYKIVHRRRSYASLMVKTEKEKEEKSTVDIIVGKDFKPIKNIPVEMPGRFYYTLFPKEHTSPAYSLVVDVAVTGVKKTVIIRSSIQFKNHLQDPVDILYMDSALAVYNMQLLATIQPNELYPVPIDKTQSFDYYVRRAGLDFKPLGPPILWKNKRDCDDINFKCVLNGEDSVRDFIRVHCKEEKYKQTRDLPTEEFPHFVFHLYPPVVVQNLLPFEIFIDSLDSGYTPRSVKSGEYIPIHEIDLDASPKITVRVTQERKSNLRGHFTASKKPPEYMNFTVETENNDKIELGVHTEDLGYLKMSVYSPFWMVNKTGLTLEYKEGYTAIHPVGKDIILFSTSGSKSKVQLRALTEHGSYTEWTKGFSLNAVGTSGSYVARLGEQTYKFGVEVRLSQFTLTKLVIFTPYYLLVNEANFDLHVHEENLPVCKTMVHRGDMSSFWPLAPNANMIVLAGGRDNKSSSIPFNFRKSDFAVLQLDGNDEIVALCVEIQESESATIVTFSPYYPGCVPVQIINHFPDMTLEFKQESKSPRAIVHTLAPREVLNYTWDDPGGKKMIRWTFPSATKIHNRKPIDVIKDAQRGFNMKLPQTTTPSAEDSSLSLSKSVFHTPSGLSDDWLAIDESLTENLVATTPDEEGDESSLSSSSASLSVSSSMRSSQSGRSTGSYRGYWKSFVDGLQRVLIFTPDEGVIDRIKAANSYSIPLFEATLSVRNIGISLVDNNKKRELAYIAIIQSGVIWQIDKGKKVWKNVSNSVNVLLEEAYQSKSIDVKQKNLSVNLETMEMYAPIRGKLRRSHYDGVFVRFGLSEKDYSVNAKIGYVQIDNQLPFSVYPQVLYPIPPPPTVASATEPKPFVEATVILKRGPDQSTVTHFKYIHVLVQKMAVNVDLGFILSLVDFFSLSQEDLQLEAERVKSDLDFVGKSLKETIVPELADDFKINRSFFDVLHLAPIKINLSFNIRSVGKNKSDDEITVGDRFLQLFLHSIGVILTSVQETEMKFSFFHLEYQPTTGRGLTNLLTKHYRNQALFQLHTIIFGLDALGNPVSVVRGVVEGAVDLFYEPIKGSVLGPEEFFEGLSIGLKSFFGAGVLGGITGATARITGTVGDVLSKLTFDEDFIDKRQQQKTRPPKLGQKLGGFARNLFEGVTGVVTQPVKGLQKEGAVGLLKGTGRGLVGLIVRPTGGLVDLASGTLSFVSRKTQVGSIEITDIRPPRFIGRDGVVTPYSPTKALGNALLVNVDEGKFVETDFYFGHVEVNMKPVQFVLVTDRHFMLIERRVLDEGWKTEKCASFKHFATQVEVKDVNVVIHYLPNIKGNRFPYLTLRNMQLAHEVAKIVNEAYKHFIDEQ